MKYEEFYSLWKEPVLFEVEVVEARYCRAEHKKGDTYLFSWNTPEGLCGEAFVGMYPLLFSLRTGGDMTLLSSDTKNVKIYTCPSRVVRFKITASEQCCLCGNKESLEKCKVSVGEKTKMLKLCSECRLKYSQD